MFPSNLSLSVFELKSPEPPARVACQVENSNLAGAGGGLGELLADAAAKFGRNAKAKRRKFLALSCWSVAVVPWMATML